MSTSTRPMTGRIAPDRWPTEMPLFVAVVFAAVVMWLVLAITIVGILYALLIAVFFFLSHVAFVSYLRGSGVRLGPDQFPELHKRIEELARAMDLEPPAAYLTQAGGALNAFATRFLGRNIMVLYSDLLEACGDNEGARDMIIAHELGHLRSGHLRWVWLTLPGHFVPFLGSALSRAREYTCDRFGLAGAGNVHDATLGMAILSAGPKYGPKVNLRAFANQRHDTNSGWMTIGEWFSSHPPLSKRVVAMNPTISPERFHPTRGRVLAVAILMVAMIGGTGLTVVAATVGAGFFEAIQEVADLPAEGLDVADAEAASAQVRTDLERLSSFIAQEWAEAAFPETIDEVRERWSGAGLGAFPFDPFDGYEYGYDRLEDGYRLWSSGPDAVPGTEDDIWVQKS
jgi:Zn-dependent protease with chaperone function